jgi:hypothetical protein
MAGRHGRFIFAAKELRMSVRVASLEIFKFCSGDKARRQRWLDISVDLQHASNRWWQVWEQWHVQNRSVEQMKAFLDVYAAWRANGKQGDKPKPPVEAVPKELAKLLYETISREFRRLHSRTTVLFLNRIQQTVVKRKSASGNLSGWLSILFAYEGRPSFTRPQPIPFDKQPKSPQVELLPPADATQNWRVRIRIEAAEVPGRVGKGGRPPVRQSVVEVCELMTRKRKVGRDKSELEKVVAGKAKLLGSYLVYDRGKWYIKFTIDEEIEKLQLDADKVARLRAGRGTPWYLWVPGRRRPGRRGGFGYYIAGMRRKIGYERRERKEHYRHAGSVSKGRGRKRATAAWTKLSDRWRRFVKHVNQNFTTQIVRELVRQGIGKLEYWQPEPGSRFAESRYLARQGKTPELRDGTAWDWFQVKTVLAYKCQRAGIEFVAVKHGASKDDETSSGEVAA